MADDIVERLRYAEDNGICEWQVLIDAADEIERLREQVRWASDRTSEWKLETYKMNTEIELLRAALAIAAGMISTLPPYEDWHPEAVMEMLLEEARRG